MDSFYPNAVDKKETDSYNIRSENSEFSPFWYPIEKRTSNVYGKRPAFLNSNIKPGTNSEDTEHQKARHQNNKLKSRHLSKFKKPGHENFASRGKNGLIPDSKHMQKIHTKSTDHERPENKNNKKHLTKMEVEETGEYSREDDNLSNDKENQISNHNGWDDQFVNNLNMKDRVQNDNSELDNSIINEAKNAELENESPIEMPNGEFSEEKENNKRDASSSSKLHSEEASVRNKSKRGGNDSADDSIESKSNINDESLNKIHSSESVSHGTKLNIRRSNINEIYKYNTKKRREHLNSNDSHLNISQSLSSNNDKINKIERYLNDFNSTAAIDVAPALPDLKTYNIHGNETSTEKQEDLRKKMDLDVPGNITDQNERKKIKKLASMSNWPMNEHQIINRNSNHKSNSQGSQGSAYEKNEDSQGSVHEKNEDSQGSANEKNEDSQELSINQRSEQPNYDNAKVGQKKMPIDFTAFGKKFSNNNNGRLLHHLLMKKSESLSSKIQTSSEVVPKEQLQQSNAHSKNVIEAESNLNKKRSITWRDVPVEKENSNNVENQSAPSGTEFFNVSDIAASSNSEKTSTDFSKQSVIPSRSLPEDFDNNEGDGLMQRSNLKKPYIREEQSNGKLPLNKAGDFNEIDLNQNHYNGERVQSPSNHVENKHINSRHSYIEGEQSNDEMPLNGNSISDSGETSSNNATKIHSNYRKIKNSNRENPNIREDKMDTSDYSETHDNNYDAISVQSPSNHIEHTNDEKPVNKEILDYDENLSNNDNNNNNDVGIHHPSDHFKITESDSRHPSIREQQLNDDIPLNTKDDSDSNKSSINNDYNSITLKRSPSNTSHEISFNKKDANLTPFINNEHVTEAVRSLPNSATIENFNSKHSYNRDKQSDAENPENSDNTLKDSNYNAAPAHYPSSPVKLGEPYSFKFNIKRNEQDPQDYEDNTNINPNILPDKNSKVDQKVSTMMEDFKVRKTILKDKASNKETNIVENENQKVVDKIQVYSSQGKKTSSDVEEMGAPEEVGIGEKEISKSKPSFGKPHKPSIEKPEIDEKQISKSKPSFGKPHKPSIEKPEIDEKAISKSKPSFGKKHKPSIEKPRKPSIQKSYKPSIEKPSKPIIEKPSKPIKSKPSIEKPSKPIKSKPSIEKPRKSSKYIPSIGQPPKPSISKPSIDKQKFKVKEEEDKESEKFKNPPHKGGKITTSKTVTPKEKIDKKPVGREFEASKEGKIKGELEKEQKISGSKPTIETMGKKPKPEHGEPFVTNKMDHAEIEAEYNEFPFEPPMKGTKDDPYVSDYQPEEIDFGPNERPLIIPPGQDLDRKKMPPFKGPGPQDVPETGYYEKNYITSNGKGTIQKYRFSTEISHANEIGEFQKEEKMEKASKTILRNKLMTANESSHHFEEKKTEIKDNKESYHEAFIEEKDENKYPNNINGINLERSALSANLQKGSIPPSFKTESKQKMNNLGNEEVDYAENLNDYNALDYGTRSRISKSPAKSKLSNIDNEFDYDDKEYQKDYPEDAKDYNDIALEKDYTDYSTKQYDERDELEQQDGTIDDIKRRQTSFRLFNNGNSGISSSKLNRESERSTHGTFSDATQPNSDNDKNNFYGLNATEVTEPKPEGPKIKRDIQANKITLKQNSDISSSIENHPSKVSMTEDNSSNLHWKIKRDELGIIKCFVVIVRKSEEESPGAKQARQEPKSPFELPGVTEAITEGSSGNVVYITLKTTTMDLQRRYNDFVLIQDKRDSKRIARHSKNINRKRRKEAGAEKNN
ncbi:uncharacterized protein CDAR_584911 [Caerostris darwini]|uniref:Uncharacterized protein n=1 Tax=Caerostris darwini TaxID=1538125 RepID=A0AAV4UDM6_9ARAC|nr:uncharacterized protein CDAR_584911 [Caerostris darwini]